MKKTNTRVRLNDAAKTAPTQAPKVPEELASSIAYLRSRVILENAICEAMALLTICEAHILSNDCGPGNRGESVKAGIAGLVANVNRNLYHGFYGGGQ